MFFLRFIKSRYLESVYGLKRGKGKKGGRGKERKRKEIRKKTNETKSKENLFPNPFSQKSGEGALMSGG